MADMHEYESSCCQEPFKKYTSVFQQQQSSCQVSPKEHTVKMGIIVRLVSSGLGMASEAIHDYRARSHSRSQSRSGQDQSPNPAVPSSSSRSLAPPFDEAPPAYVEVADEATADQLVRSGRAERVTDYGDDKKGRSRSGRPGDDDDDSSSSDDDSDFVEVDDEAAWELDDMAERVAPTSSLGSSSGSLGEAESEEATIKKEELMIRDMLRMCGPPPQPVRRIPCPVIIPQRRPRNKDRGFVRAYAPVLEECGIGQDVFVKFLHDWLIASKVRKSLCFFQSDIEAYVLIIPSV